MIGLPVSKELLDEALTVKDFMEQMGLTQRQMAELTGKSQTTVRKWQSNPNVVVVGAGSKLKVIMCYCEAELSRPKNKLGY